MTHDIERVHDLIQRSERDEGAGEGASKREQYLYELIRQLEQPARNPVDALPTLEGRTGNYQIRYERSV
jgi:hypothetical protein